jgi:Protein of unknown function (DUF3754)
MTCALRARTANSPATMLTQRPPRKESYIPARLGDVAAALAADGGKRIEELVRLIAAIFHYESYAKLERLRDLYFPLDPDRPADAPAAPDSRAALAAFEQALEATLVAGNFEEIEFEALGAHARKHVLNDLRLKTSDAGIRKIRFFCRGGRDEPFTLRRFYGLFKREIQAEVLADVVLMVALDDTPPKRQAAHGLKPGQVMVKHFRNVARHDLAALHPGARPTMKRTDQVFLGVPAIAGGAPLFVQLGAAIPVIFGVLAAYFGAQGVVDENNLKKALAAVSGVVALGAFVMRQWMKYERQSLRYQMKLADTVYFRNAANNSGVLYMLIAAAEEQDAKEAALAYHVLDKLGPLTKDALDAACEAFLSERMGAAVDFEIQDALGKLLRLDLIAQDGETYRAAACEEALKRLDEAWDGIFQYAAKG